MLKRGEGSSHRPARGAIFILTINEPGMRQPDGPPTLEVPRVEVLWEGCTDGRNYLCVGFHVWAELAQDAPGQERRGHLNVMVTLCPLVANPRLGLAQACLWNLGGKQAPRLRPGDGRWATTSGTQLPDDVGQDLYLIELVHKVTAINGTL